VRISPADMRTHELINDLSELLNEGREAGLFGPESMTFTKIEELRQRFHLYENAITWGVSSVERASMLDKNYDMYVQVEKLRAIIRDHWPAAQAEILIRGTLA